MRDLINPLIEFGKLGQWIENNKTQDTKRGEMERIKRMKGPAALPPLASISSLSAPEGQKGIGRDEKTAERAGIHHHQRREARWKSCCLHVKEISSHARSSKLSTHPTMFFTPRQ